MRPEKAALADLVTTLMRDSAYLYFVSYKGLSVAKFNTLRDALYATGSQCQVLKNSYLRMGAAAAELDVPPTGVFEEDTAVVFGAGDPAATAKVIKKFSEDNAQVSFKGGVLEHQFLGAQAAKDIAELPPIEQIHAEIVHCIKAPAASLVRVLKDAAGGRLVRLLNNHANADHS